MPSTARFLRSPPEKFTLILCNNCELVYLSPLPEKQVFDELYINSKQFDEEAYRGTRAKSAMDYYSDRFNALLQEIDAADKNIRVLEVGAGLSWLCRVAKLTNKQYVTVAQDITSEAVERCEWVDHYFVGELNLTLEQIGRFAPYQIISLTHVIEHLPNPIETLNICSNMLDKGGVIFITAPHRPKGWEISSQIEIWTEWRYNNVPKHLQYFNRKSMKICADKAGLNVVFFDASAEEGQALEAWLKKSETSTDYGTQPMKQIARSKTPLSQRRKVRSALILATRDLPQ